MKVVFRCTKNPGLQWTLTKDKHLTYDMNLAEYDLVSQIQLKLSCITYFGFKFFVSIPSEKSSHRKSKF